MPIAINGSGTVTGISVGGLPDGIVDTDMIAANAVTAPKRGTGAILQVVQIAYDTANNITNASSYEDTGLQGSITPTSSSSKILVMVSQSFRLAANTNDTQNGGAIRILRGSTNISQKNAYELYNSIAGLSNTQFSYDVYNNQILDSPSTTSSVTYKTQAIVYGSGNSIYLQYGGRSYLTLIEVAG